MKKFLLSLMTSLILLFSFAPFLTIKAQETEDRTSTTPTWYNSSFTEWYGKVYDPNNPSEIFGERYTAAQVQWIIYGLFAFLINSFTGQENAEVVQCFLNNVGDVSSCIDTLKAKTKAGASENSNTSYVAPREPVSLFSLVFATNRPISGIGYIASKIKDFSIVPTARAQTLGFGFRALSPIQDLWKGVRDISYGLFVIAAVILAFMIMFRVKISPQVVISVQSAIPKVVIAIVLVTFSYAIAGFLIDLMYVVIGFISLSFAPFLGKWLNADPVAVFTLLTRGNTDPNVNINFGILLLGLVYLVGFILGFILLLVYHVGLLISTLVGLIVSPIVGVFGFMIPLLLAFVGLLILWFFLKTLFSLVKAFAQIVLLTIFAPLQIVAGVVVPSLGFGSWVKSFVSNLAVFVVTGVLMLFSYVFLLQAYDIGFSDFKIDLGIALFQAIFGQGITGAAFPSQTSADWPPLLGGGGSNSGTGLLLLMVSFVVFSLIPKANDIVQSFISGKPFSYGSALGEAAGFAWGKTGAPVWEGYTKYRTQGKNRDMVSKMYEAEQKLTGSLPLKKSSG